MPEIDTNPHVRTGEAMWLPIRLSLLILAIASLLHCRSSTLKAQNPTATESVYDQAVRAAASGNSKLAIMFSGQAIEQSPNHAQAYYLRGRERFRIGQVHASVSDFDKYVELRPQFESRQWERGIALYYDGQYQRGAKQFEMYQTYHNNDVENSVWRYLCEAKTKGVAAAEQNILPIRNDKRVPMMQVYEMFRGKLTPAEVLAATKTDEPTDDVLDGRLFYARLYVGLYYEANRNVELARKYILLSADEHKKTQHINRYMWDVARVHAERLRSPE